MTGRVRVERGDAMTVDLAAARRADAVAAGVRVEPAVQRGGAGGRAAARGGRDGRAHPGDGAARGGGAPRRRGPATRQYGAVSVKVAYFAEAQVVGLGAADRVRAPPKVDSALVRLRPSRAPPVTVPSADGLFALVRAGFAQRRKMLRRSLAPLLGDRTPDVLAAAGSPHRRAPRRSGSTTGPRWPAVRRRGRMRLAARPRHRVPQAQPVAPRPRAVAPTATTTSSRSSSRSANPTTSSRSFAVPRARRRAGRGRRRRGRRGRPADHRTSRSSPPRSCSCAPGRSGHGVRLVLRKHIPAGGGLGGGSADAAAALARRARAARRRHRRRGRARASRPRSVPTCRSACAAARRGCAAAARSSSRCRCAPGSRSWSAIPPFRLVDARRVQGVGRARRPAVRRASVPAPRRSRRSIRELANDLEPAAEARGAPAGRVPAALEAAAGSRRRCWPGAARPTWCPSPTRVDAPGPRRRGGPSPACARRRHDERRPRRPPRQLAAASFGAYPRGIRGAVAPKARRREC